MCGIFGYVGKEDPLEICIKGLEQLEYRGYDSSWIAGVVNGEIEVCKEVGKLSNMKKAKTQKSSTSLSATPGGLLMGK